ncbi:MAG: hypothetical protein R3B38_01555 [Patescibacteria group bacterium]
MAGILVSRTKFSDYPLGIWIISLFSAIILSQAGIEQVWLKKQVYYLLAVIGALYAKQQLKNIKGLKVIALPSRKQDLSPEQEHKLQDMVCVSPNHSTMDFN